MVDHLNTKPNSGSIPTQTQVNIRTLQFENEEEKEVPNEHLNDNEITTTRRGCNLTARKGFSFENMMGFSSKNYFELENLENENQKEREEAEADFLMIDCRKVILKNI